MLSYGYHIWKGTLAVAHLKKYAKAALGHMTCHYERAVDDHGQYLKFGNQEIDPTRTSLNYNLAPEREGGQLAFIQNRCNEVHCLKRDDVKVMCSWIVTAPWEVSETWREREFFERTYDFLTARYGVDNVVSAYVHRDETTPHIHFAFVPVVEDTKHGGFKVSAKEVVNKIDLQSFHPDLSRYLEKELECELSLWTGVTIDGNKSIKQLKAETLEEAKRDASYIVHEAAQKAEKVRDSINISKSELEGLEGRVVAFKGAAASVDEIDSMGKPGIGGKFVLKKEEAEQLKTWAKAYAVNRYEIENLQERTEVVSRREDYIDQRYQELNSREDAIRDKEARTEVLYGRQKDLNKELEKSDKKYAELMNGFEAGSEMNTNLNERVTELELENKLLTERIAGAYESLGAVTQATGMLQWDAADYKVQNLTKKQSRLIEAIGKYSAYWAEKDGFPNIADKIRKFVCISKGLQEQIKLLEPQKSIDRGR